MNRDDETVQEANQSDEIDRSGRPLLLGLALLQARQYDAAIRELSVRADIQRQDPYIEFFLFEAYWFKGMKRG